MAQDRLRDRPFDAGATPNNRTVPNPAACKASGEDEVKAVYIP